MPRRTSTEGSGEFDLTPYEEQREPHLPIMDDTVVQLRWSELKDGLMKCVICRDIFTQTRTTKECLHRFCHECIRKYFSMTGPNSRQCPICRKKLISGRDLRPDDNFDKLIATIFPDRSIFELHHQQLMEKIRPFNNPKANMEIYNTGTKAQSINAAMKVQRARKTPRGDYLAESDHEEEDVAPRQQRTKRVKTKERQAVSGGDHVELVFEPHPMDPNAQQFRGIHELSYKYLTTTDKCTVGHLAKYLSIRVKGTPEAALLDEPSFYTEGFHGYIKWSATDSLSDLMHWCRIVKPEAFKIYYASTSLLEVPKKK